jgi:hypothetical protein
MQFDIGLAGFLVFALYYVILKAVLQIVNIECRRAGLKVPAAVSGLYS